MKLDEAVSMLNEYVCETGTPAQDAVRLLWEKIFPLPEQDAQKLMQASLATLVAISYRRPDLGRSVSVEHDRRPMKEHTVTVELLQETRYNIDGKVKAISVCTRYDILTLRDNARRGKEGFARYEKVWEHVAERLQTCKKNTVDALGHGEQIKIARMISDLHAFQFPRDLVQIG